MTVDREAITEAEATFRRNVRASWGPRSDAAMLLSRLETVEADRDAIAANENMLTNTIREAWERASAWETVARQLAADLEEVIEILSRADGAVLNLQRLGCRLAAFRALDTPDQQPRSKHHE